MGPRSTFIVALLLLVLTSCRRTPPRVGKGPIVTAANDRNPTPKPAARRDLGALFSAEAFVADHFVEDLRAQPAPRARDVNRFDDVVDSAWFVRFPPRDVARAASPSAPLTSTPEPELQSRFDVDGAHVVSVDGVRYDVVPDDKHRWRAGAMMVSASVAAQLGYRVPPTRLDHERAVWVEREGDAGSTPGRGTRSDDDNDVIPHEDRRSLRVYGLFMSFVGGSDYAESGLRDRYVGASPRGHVIHEVSPVPDALGRGAFLRRQDPSATDANFGERLVTLGFAPRAEAVAPPRGRAHLLELTAEQRLGDLSPNFPPGDRVRPDDGFWFARRLMTVSLPQAVARARIPKPAARHDLLQALERRRIAMVRTLSQRVTPLVLERFVHRPETPTVDVQFYDALSRWEGHPPSERTRYWAWTIEGGATHLDLRSSPRGRLRLVWRGASPAAYTVIGIQRCDEGRCRSAAQLHLAPDGSFRAFLH